AEGGTGAAPLEYEDHVGMPLTDGLMIVHNALVGTGLRHHIRIGASGKVAAGNEIVKRLIQGADYTNSARAMMMAIGCIQAQICHTDKCPVGVTTQDRRRQRALHVDDKSVRVQRYHSATVAQVGQIMASLGTHNPAELAPHLLRRNMSPRVSRSYADLYEWLENGQLLSEVPPQWSEDWAGASPATFARSWPANTMFLTPIFPNSFSVTSFSVTSSSMTRTSMTRISTMKTSMMRTSMMSQSSTPWTYCAGRRFAAMRPSNRSPRHRPPHRSPAM